MLMCWNFVISFAVSSVINWNIWVLLQLIIKGLFSLNVIALNSLLIKTASFAVCNRANNLAFMLDVVIIFCLFAFYAIGPLNNFIMYFYKFFLSTELFVNNALLAQINDCISFLPFFLLFCFLSFMFFPLLFIPFVSPL